MKFDDLVNAIIDDDTKLVEEIFSSDGERLLGGKTNWLRYELEHELLYYSKLSPNVHEFLDNVLKEAKKMDCNNNTLHTIGIKFQEKIYPKLSEILQRCNSRINTLRDNLKFAEMDRKVKIIKSVIDQIDEFEFIASKFQPPEP